MASAIELAVEDFRDLLQGSLVNWSLRVKIWRPVSIMGLGMGLKS